MLRPFGNAWDTALCVVGIPPVVQTADEIAVIALHHATSGVVARMQVSERTA